MMSKKYPESVFTKDRKGNLEVRNLVSRGRYLIYEYRDVKTFKKVESDKKKLYLKDKDGGVTEYYIILLKTRNRSLLIEPENLEKKVRKVWNDKTQKEEDLW